MPTFSLPVRVDFCLEGHSSAAGRPQGDITGIQFTILAEAFFSLCGHGGDRRSEDTGWPQLHSEATWPEREREEGEQ